MHPITLTRYSRSVAVTRSRSSRRRARRAVIAVVAGLCAAGSGQAFADPPQNQVEHPHLPGSHASIAPHWRSLDVPQFVIDRHRALGSDHAPATGGRTVAVGTRPDGGSLEVWPAPLIATAVALLAAVAVARRRLRPAR